MGGVESFFFECYTLIAKTGYSELDIFFSNIYLRLVVYLIIIVLFPTVYKAIKANAIYTLIEGFYRNSLQDIESGKAAVSQTQCPW